MDEDNQSDLCGVRCIHRDRIAAARDIALPAGEYEAMAVLFRAMALPFILSVPSLSRMTSGVLSAGNIWQ